MIRRHWLRAAVAAICGLFAARLPGAALAADPPGHRVRPGDPGWPDAAAWERLNRAVGGRLLAVRSPLEACREAPANCARLFESLKNPYYLGDEPGLTQTLGWVDAWTSRPSAHAVAARTADDVAAAVNFARDNNLRLVVKGGGHSYKGASNAADSLLVWTRAMNAIEVHDGFVPAGCGGSPVPAASVGAGAIWGQVYDAVTTRAGRYVQGGGCLTVGVAGLVQAGGFGSFSKAYGLAAASLLEAEVVTADGAVRIANACTHPDLFWALKAGGGGFGVVTRLTLRTYDLPEVSGGAFATIQANSDEAFRRLVGLTLSFCREALVDPRWGEQLRFRPNNTLDIAMVFQGLDQAGAEAVWRPFLDGLAASPQEFRIASPLQVLAAPARRFWDPEFLKSIPGLVLADDRPGAPASNIFWAGNREEAAQVLHAYQSAWLPAALLQPDRQDGLADALFAASRHWSVTLHLNKGLAGAPAGALAAARDTAMNPAVLDAFALAISAAEGPPAYPGIPGHEPGLAAARRDAAAVGRAMAALRAILPPIGCYGAESDYFEADWQRAFWGPHYARLLAVKDRYDPDGLFTAHHTAGSERWSPDGFSRLR